MRRSISTTIAQMSSTMTTPSPFSFLKEKEVVNLDKKFPNSRKSYAFEIGEDISGHMKAKGITYAMITTASRTGPVVRSIVHLESLREDNPDLENVSDEHPDISQHLSEGYYVV